MSSHASLSAAANDRKARLAQLRAAKRKQPGDEIAPPESDRVSPALGGPPDDAEMAESGIDGAEKDVARLHLSGRNYDPEARGVKLGFEAPPNLAAGNNTLEAKAAELEADLRRQQEEEEENDITASADPASAANKGIDLFKLQPKKPNWDLKRELNRRLEPLNVRTDHAIAKYIRERASSKPQSTTAAGSAKADAGDEGALEGAALVESIRLREQEAEEDEQREREAEEED